MSSKSLGKGLVIFIVVAILFAMGAANLSTAQAVPGSEDTAFSSANEKEDVLIGFYHAPGPSERALVRSHGGEISRQFNIVDVIAASMTPQAAESLAENPRVRYVEPDGPVYALGQEVPWGIDRVFGDESYSFDTWEITRGDGIAVAILDTGIDEKHEDLPVLSGGTTTVDDTHWGSDGHGHGTHVAGTVAALDNEVGVVGVGPDIGLYAVKVLDDGGGGTASSVVAGIEWAVKEGIPVLNMSLGSSSDSETMEDACDAAYDKGHLLVAAAGNSGNLMGRGDNVIYPAKYESVIAVAASNKSDSRALFSSTGPAVELIAPGVDILSTVPGNGYEEKNGTSMASPHAAGAAALAWAVNPDLTSVQIREALQQTAENLGLSPNHQGHGLVRADLAVAEAKSLEDEVTEYEVVVVAPEDVEETAEGTYSYNFEIKNTGTEDDNYGLTVDSDDEKFIASVQEEVSVEAGATENVSVEVKITDTASPGDSAEIILTATSKTDSTVSDSGSMVVTLIGEPVVNTVEASDVTDTSAILQGELTDLGGADAVEVWFEWADNEAFTDAKTTNKMTMGNTGYFKDTIDGLEPSTTYYFRAVAENEVGVDKGEDKTFTTHEKTELTKPEIITFEVNPRTTGPWKRADVKWEVYHQDGALNEVKTELLDGDNVVDTVTTSVSGESASGEHNLRTRGNADAVRLTVTDTAGQETTRTEDLEW